MIDFCLPKNPLIPEFMGILSLPVEFKEARYFYPTNSWNLSTLSFWLSFRNWRRRVTLCSYLETKGSILERFCHLVGRIYFPKEQRSTFMRPIILYELKLLWKEKEIFNQLSFKQYKGCFSPCLFIRIFWKTVC